MQADIIFTCHMCVEDTWWNKADLLLATSSRSILLAEVIWAPISWSLCWSHWSVQTVAED